jgi:hypothetical protein
MAQITNIITIHEYNKMTAEQRAALSDENMLAVVQQDWEEVRIQFTIAAIGLVKGVYNIHTEVDKLVKHSIRIADAFVAELKKGGEK